MRLEHDVPLAPLTTLRLGGNASHVAIVEREADVEDALAEAGREGLDAYVLGGGSNLVVADEGVRAVVLRMALHGVDIRRDGGSATVTLAAGEPWDTFVATAVREGLSGVECLAGIPGLVGATPIQNVGAYGQEVSDTIVGVRAYDRDARTFVALTPEDCAFGYRTSRLKGSSRYIVTAVTFRLLARDTSAPIRYAELCRALGIAEGGTAPSSRVRETVVRLRRGKGMVLDAADPESVSAGSFFVNPVVDDAALARVLDAAEGQDVPRHASGPGRWKIPAAWLIERAGFPRGFAAGPVHVSSRHALALVHGGGGTTRDLLALARRIVDGVERSFGVRLVPEPVMLGCAL